MSCSCQLSQIDNPSMEMTINLTDSQRTVSGSWLPIITPLIQCYVHATKVNSGWPLTCVSVVCGLWPTTAESLNYICPPQAMPTCSSAQILARATNMIPDLAANQCLADHRADNIYFCLNHPPQHGSAICRTLSHLLSSWWNWEFLPFHTSSQCFHALRVGSYYSET